MPAESLLLLLLKGQWLPQKLRLEEGADLWRTGQAPQGPLNAGPLLCPQGSHGSRGWAGTCQRPGTGTAGMRPNKAASAFRVPTSRSGRIVVGWEGPHIRSRDSVQILVLPPNDL